MFTQPYGIDIINNHAHFCHTYSDYKWGSSSFYLPIRFFYYLANFNHIYKVEQDSLYFFLEGGFKGIYLRERNFTLSYVVSEI